LTTVPSRLQHTVNDYRTRLLHHEDQAEAALRSTHANTLAVIQPQLNKLYDEIATKMNAGEPIPPSFIYQRLRLEAIQLLIQQQIDNYAAIALQQTRMNQHLGAQLGLQAGMDLLHATVPTGVQYAFGIPGTQAIVNLIGATQAGSPLADLFAGWGKEAATGVTDALTTGITLGNNPRVVARVVQRVMRDKADIALRESRNRALVLSRNEMLRAYKSSNLATYRANSDVVSQWRWQCAKQVRTCAVCLAMDGSLHDLSEELDSHICCRCAPVPVTRSWTDILSPLGVDTSGIPETSISASSYQTGVEWFEQQDARTQQNILGSKAAYDLYQSGDVTLHDFVGVKYDADWGTSRYQRSVKALVK
jgi:Phage Mu protein F like protein